MQDSVSSGPQSEAGIREKRIQLELKNLQKLVNEHFKLEFLEHRLGQSVMIEIDREAIGTQLLDESIKAFTFEVLLTKEYPFSEPQVFCHTKFAHDLLTLTDGRDLFKEITGPEPWVISNKLSMLVQLIPDFIQDMAILEDDMHVVGTFHLGQVYNIKRWADSDKEEKKASEAYVEPCGVFQCQEQDEEDESKFLARYLVVTPGVLLLIEPLENAAGYGTLQAWASLQSLNKIRRNNVMQELMTLIFKAANERQPWVLNLMVQNHHTCLELICRHLQSMGVKQKKQAAQRQQVTKQGPAKQVHLTEGEVSKQAVQMTDIDVILQNMEVYEAEFQVQESTGALDLSTIQTLLKLYQQAIEYYSALDDTLYNDVLNRMQVLLQKPEVSVMLHPETTSGEKQQIVRPGEALKAEGQAEPAANSFSIGGEEEAEEEVEEEEYEDEEEYSDASDEKYVEPAGDGFSPTDHKVEGEPSTEVKPAPQNFSIGDEEEEGDQFQDCAEEKASEPVTEQKAELVPSNNFSIGDEDDN